MLVEGRRCPVVEDRYCGAEWQRSADGGRGRKRIIVVQDLILLPVETKVQNKLF